MDSVMYIRNSPTKKIIDAKIISPLFSIFVIKSERLN